MREDSAIKSMFELFTVSPIFKFVKIKLPKKFWFLFISFFSSGFLPLCRIQTKNSVVSEADSSSARPLYSVVRL